MVCRNPDSAEQVRGVGKNVDSVSRSTVRVDILFALKDEVLRRKIDQYVDCGNTCLRAHKKAGRIDTPAFVMNKVVFGTLQLALQYFFCRYLCFMHTVANADTFIRTADKMDSRMHCKHAVNQGYTV